MRTKSLLRSPRRVVKIEYQKARIKTEDVARLLKEGKTRAEIVSILKANPKAIDYHIGKVRNGQFNNKHKKQKKVDYNKYIKWEKYNEGLVVRGEALFNVEIFKFWGEELKEMNTNKRGAPYKYPNSFIKFLFRIKCALGVGYRQIEGIARMLIQLIPVVDKAIDYTTLQKRLMAMTIELEVYQSEGEHDTAIDSTGIKTTNRGEYKSTKYKGKKKKEYVKLHVKVSTQTKEVLACEVTPATIHDSKVVSSLIKEAKKRVKINSTKLDRAYDAKKIYEELLKENITPVIKPLRKGTLKRLNKRYRKLQAKKRKSGLNKAEEAEMARIAVVKEYLKNTKLWSKKNNYGARWAVECFFSAFKRIFSEHVFSRKYEMIVKELKFKCSLLNLMMFLCKGYMKDVKVTENTGKQLKLAA